MDTYTSNALKTHRDEIQAILRKAMNEINNHLEEIRILSEDVLDSDEGDLTFGEKEALIVLADARDVYDGDLDVDTVIKTLDDIV